MAYIDPNSGQLIYGTPADPSVPQFTPNPAAFPGVAGLSDQRAPTQTQDSGRSSGGDSGGSSGRDREAEEAERKFQSALNDSFKSTFKFLDQAESALRGDESAAIENVERLVGESRATLDQQRSEGERAISEQQSAGEERKEDALTAAVRLFNELKRGGQQRFGGASSAGAAFGELANTEFQRNAGNIRRDFGTFMEQIDTARNTLRERYNTAVNNLMSQKTRLINDVRRDFQSKLLEINRSRADAEGAKEQRKLQALQDLRNQIFQIELNTAQGIQGAQSQLNAIEQRLLNTANSMMGLSQQATGQFSSATNLDPQTENVINPGQGVDPALLTGVRNEDEEEDFLAGFPSQNQNLGLV